VETWRTAGVELEAIRRRELRSLDTQEAIRQIFGAGNEVFVDGLSDLGTGGTAGLVRAAACR
jgi:hypothetical protein